MHKLIQLARGQSGRLLVAILLGASGGVLTVLQAFWLSRAVSRVFLFNDGLNGITPLLLALVGAIVFRAGLVYGAETTARAASCRIRADLRHRLYEHIQALGPGFLAGETRESNVRSGELINTALEGVESLDAYFSQYLPQLAMAVLIPLCILGFIFPNDGLSAVILLLTAPLLPIMMILIGSAGREQTRRQWLGLSRMAAYFLDIIQGLPTLKTLGRSLDQLQKIAHVSERYRQTTLSVLRITFLSAFALEFIATVSTAIVAVQIGLRLLAGNLEFEPAFFILLLAPEFYLPIRLLGLRFHAGMSGIEAGRRIFDLLDLPLPAQTALTPAPTFTFSTPTIVFEDVYYTYQEERHALRGISFSLEPGKVTAITGPSGAGKSTISSLLLRFLHPQSGRITVDGIDLSSIPITDWRAYLSWVPQTPYLFNDSITANLRLANPHASIEQLAEVLKIVRADEFIEKLPNKYDTILGERGARLSAGQAQRLVLARAFLKSSGLVILDEPTSHLDPGNEACIGQAARMLAPGRAILLIAHRPETLAFADTIIEINDGVVTKMRAAPPRGDTSQIKDPYTLPVRNSEQVPVLPSLKAEKIVLPPSTSQDERKNKDILWRTLALLKPFRARVLLSILLGFATILSNAGLMAAAAYIISYAALQPSIAVLQVAIVGVRFFGLSRAIFRYLERLVSHDITLRLLANWRTWFYQALEPLAPARLWRYHTGDLLNRVIADISVLENLYVRSVAPPLTALLVATAGAIFLSCFVQPLGPVLLGFLAVGGVLLPITLHVFARQPGRELIQARAQLSTLLSDGIQGMPDLLIFGQAAAHQKRVAHEEERLYHHQTHLNRIGAVQSALQGLIAQLCMLAIFVLTAPYVVSGRLNGIWLGALMLTALATFEAVQPIAQAAQTLEASLQAARRLFQIVDAAPEVRDPRVATAVPYPTRLEVSGLSFNYPDGTAALQDISFILERGQPLALIGPSGAGKTTLINLLLRYWEYQYGHIYLNGQELKAFSGKDLRAKFAVVSQNVYIFNTSLRENLRIAHPTASQEEIESATRLAQIDDFIRNLPEGYDTWAGETGLRLSGGQCQRIAIARALLQDTPILILDEPTANLDTETGRDVMQAIYHYAQGRMLMIITHDPYILNRSTQIIKLSEGRIIET